jgi:hypothetical protein
MRSEVAMPSDDPTWQQLAPALDDAIARLRSSDREAILLRFGQRMEFAQVAAALNLSEEAARKRVTRAIGRLRDIVARRGLADSPIALSAILLKHMTTAAPLHVMQHVVTTATAAAGATTTATLICKGAIEMMRWTMIKLTLATTACVVLAAGGGTWIAKRAMAAESKSAVAQAAAPATTSPTAVVAPIVKVDLSTPDATLKTYMNGAQQGDGQAIKATLQPASDAQRNFIDALAESITAMGDVQRAAGTKFGKDKVGMFQLSNLMGVKLPETTWNIDGDRATPASSELGNMNMVRTKGEWRIDATQMFPDNEQMKVQLERFTALSNSMKLIAADIRGGTYAKPQDAAAAAKQAMMAAMTAEGGQSRITVRKEVRQAP